MSERRDGSWVRQQRITTITRKMANSISNREKVNLEKLLAWISVTIGLTKPKALKMVEDIAIAYDWQIKDGHIFDPELKAK